MEVAIPALRRHTRALLRSRPDADKPVHACLIRALAMRHNRRADGDVRAWLLVILHNVLISQRRHSRHHLPREQEPTADVSVEAGPETATLFRAVVREFRKFSEVPCRLTSLASMEHLRYAAAARVLDVPIGTVMSRLSRARQRFSQVPQAAPRQTPRRVK